MTENSKKFMVSSFQNDRDYSKKQASIWQARLLEVLHGKSGNVDIVFQNYI